MRYGVYFIREFSLPLGSGMEYNPQVPVLWQVTDTVEKAEAYIKSYPTGFTFFIKEGATFPQGMKINEGLEE